DVLEPERRQVARADVVQLREHPRVDDVAAGDLVAAEADRALGDLQPRRPGAQRAATAAPPQGHAVPPRARLDVFEVEAEDVVAFEDVGIALADEAPALGQQRRLVQSVAAQDMAEAGRVGERDGDDAIALAGRRGELVALRRHDLDVERQASQVAEAQAAERGAAVGGEGGGDEPGRGIGAEQQRGRRAQPAASSTAARYIVASTRPTSARPVSGTITVGIERTPSATAAS